MKTDRVPRQLCSGMSELTQNNNVLHDKTMSSMDMTTNINEQVERMASLMEQMVTLMNESGRPCK